MHEMIHGYNIIHMLLDTLCDAYNNVDVSWICMPIHGKTYAIKYIYI